MPRPASPARLTLALLTAFSLMQSSQVGAADTAAAPAAASASASAPAATTPATAPAANTLRVHYHRKNGDEADWGVYSWEGPQEPSKKWIQDRFMFKNKDGFGAWTDIALAAGKVEIRFLLSNGYGHKNCNTDQNHPLNKDLASRGQEIWILPGSCEIFNSPPPLPAK